MKDEIKEILEALRDSIDDTGTDKVNFINWVDKIEDYITNLQEYYNNNVNKYEELLVKYSNLQEENERLNLELTGYREAILRNDELLGLQDYKSRCEKAIEYIKLGKTFENKEIEMVVEKLQNDLLNILNGGDDNE